MGDIFVYILKSSICLAVFYLFFKLMLSKETFHRFNRVVLISLFVFSLVIPFIEITLKNETPYSGLALNLDLLMAMAQTTSDAGAEAVNKTNGWLVAILIIYLAGVVITALITIWSFLRMYLMLKIKTPQRIVIEKNIILVIHNKPAAPFSWMRFIAISEKDYNENGREIITHELAHISRYHSADLLLAELVKIIHWFNPAAWLLKQELQNIHEYQADEAVIQKGIDAKQYQLLLIKKAVGDRLYTMANSFNHSKLKSRITMITKKKSSRPAALKALFVLPLSLLAVVAFASERVTTAFEPVSEVKITDFIQKDTIRKEVKTIIVTSVTKKEDDKGAKGESFGISYNFDTRDTTNKGFAVSYSIKNKEEKDGISKIKITSFSGKQEDSIKPLIIINGKEVDEQTMNALNPESVISINVIKDKKINDKYGDKGKYGVIIISTKTPSEKNIVIRGVGSISSKDTPLYSIDGVVCDDSLTLNSLNTESIESITVLKGAGATSIYGEKGKNGAILITLKKGKPEENKKQAVKITGTKEINEPLYVIDGVVIENFDMKSLDTATIQSINILKDSEAVKKYGEKAKNGVIEVTLKRK